MKIYCSFFLLLALMAVFVVSDVVDNVVSQLPACAQGCVKTALLDICSQDQTAKCFCTTTPLITMRKIRLCIFQNLVSQPLCSAAVAIETAIEMCAKSGYDTTGWAETSVTAGAQAGQTATKSSSVSVPTAKPSPVAGSSTSVPKPAPTSGSTTESTSASGGGNQGSSQDNKSSDLPGNQGSTQGSKSSGLSTGAIIGISVSAVVALGIVAGLIVFIVKNRRTPAARSPEEPRPTVPPPPPPPQPPTPPEYYPPKQIQILPELPPEQAAPPVYPPYPPELPAGQSVSPSLPQGYTPYPPHTVPELPPQQIPQELGLAQERPELPAAAT